MVLNGSVGDGSSRLVHPSKITYHSRCEYIAMPNIQCLVNLVKNTRGSAHKARYQIVWCTFVSWSSSPGTYPEPPVNTRKQSTLHDKIVPVLANERHEYLGTCHCPFGSEYVHGRIQQLTSRWQCAIAQLILDDNYYGAYSIMVLAYALCDRCKICPSATIMLTRQWP